ncbi:nucleotide-binding domain-containing protein [Lacinutrix algicola]|uniref:nucleotide-binding domain-containing protein n=1 Tax=Lacinutrix algicola TaxID=342954 RepID=UPI0006E41477|nr:hypothetical protein [Lacinutrix algicola]
MYNLNNKLGSFYNEVVRLKEADRNKLREYKKLNLERLNSGIDSINTKESKSYPYPTILEQGSIAMHTANRHDDNDYDIDVAVIFPKDQLPTSALNSRRLVEKFLREKTGNFSKQPEARTNAVTIWYSEGYHVDFAIYRQSIDFLGNTIYEHAGSNWKNRNPQDITNWFSNFVITKSPNKNFGATVENNQFRRIVRLLKKFTRSRENWSLPGGLVISILASECYFPDYYRDDISLVKTINSIYNRLKYNNQVYNPTDRSSELTEKSKYKNEVNRLKEKLKQAVKKLEILNSPECDEDKANEAWKWVFNSDFWKTEIKTNNASNKSFSLPSNLISLNASLHISKNGFRLNSNVTNGNFKIPKKMWLKFNASTNISVPFDVKWIVENKGDEAEAKPDLGHETLDQNIYSSSFSHWEQTAYKGKHKLICQIIKNSQVVASEKFEVVIKK